jgi:dinuclear metal center YbgI/SA1388 family protein
VRRVTDLAESPLLSDVIAVLEGMYDPRWARDWDAVGLTVGDPSAKVSRVLLAVEAAPPVIEEALAWQADLLLTHHPLMFKPVHSVSTVTPQGEAVHRLIRGGCALYTVHTNADVAAPGVSDALARVLGLTDLAPLDADAADPLDKIVTFVPDEHLDRVLDALAAAGAGRIGDYSRCAWTSAGVGTFEPGLHSNPAIGTPGERTVLPETRLESVFPRHRRAEVVAALRATHPYEEPAFDVLELASWSGPRGIGRVGNLSGKTSLRDFAMLVAEALPGTAQGVRVAGDPAAHVSRVAVCGGSGDSLLGAARASGADVFVTSDLRHHPASGFREISGEGPPFLIDVAHYASEWPWLAGLANRLEGAMDAAGSKIETHVSVRSTDPWTFRVPSPGGIVR